MAQAAGEESLQPLVEELLRALEDSGASGRALGAAGLVAGYCKTASGPKREALQEHVDSLMAVSIPQAFARLRSLYVLRACLPCLAAVDEKPNLSTLLGRPRLRDQSLYFPYL